ncbi:hypothetical protein [Sphingobium sp. KCTC 72723]|uniref:hypothetical protein n=1 Tax=Sphingobium sp. KCTC 72723 TaxID=2733867 RepID=UPI00165E3C5E|nr:hypothetical protein [Sphingobium sp. KCTC 72723]
MKDEEIILRIKTFDAANGGGVGWYEDKGAYHLYLLETEAPIARLRPIASRAISSRAWLIDFHTPIALHR